MAEFNYGKYLASLLIIQYWGKQRAKDTIDAIAKMFPVDLILKFRDFVEVTVDGSQEMRDAFDIDVATGKALDLLAKYVGVSRFYYDENGDIIELTDDELRVLIKFKAISNTSNASHYDIDTALYNFFGTRVRATSDGNMSMTFFVPSDAERVIEAAIQQKALPTPLGVEANRIIVQNARFFGFVNYNNQYAVYKTGFRDYSDPDKDGETLTYDKTEEIERQ